MAVLASDTFVRPDNADLGANWTPLGGTAGVAWKILANVARASNTGQDCAEAYTGITWPNNQWGEVTVAVTELAGAGVGDGPSIRGTVGASSNYYRLVGNASGYEFGKVVANTFTSLGTAGTTTFTGGDRVYLELQGTQPVAKKNTTNGLGGAGFGAFATDSAFSTGSVGLAYSGVEATATVSGFVGGDFSAAGIPRVLVSRPFPYKPGSPRR